MQTDDIHLNDYVTVIAGREARDRFNADSIFIFDVPRFEPHELTAKNVPKRFKHSTHMIVFRKDRQPTKLIWLFTPKGKKNEQYYIRKLDGRLWYDETEQPLETLDRRTFDYNRELYLYMNK